MANEPEISAETPADQRAVIKTALKRFQLAAEAENKNRKDGLEALKFRAGDQWPAQVKEQRTLDMRPCLTINQLPKFIRQVTNDARINRPGIKVLPNHDTTERKAEIVNGLIRQIQISSQADVAYDNACDNQATIGWGYMRILTEYCDPKSFDQDIKIKRIKNPFTVYFDPNAQEHDYSDAKWCFIVADVNKDDFLADYDGANRSDYMLSSTGDNTPGWMTDENIRIAEYFEIVEKPVNIYLLADKTVISEEEKDELAAQGLPLNIVRERESTVRTVVWRKITSVEVLEEQDWPGKYIPVIPVLGDDHDIDGKRVLKGMVYDTMDAQRMYNYHSTAYTEAVALAPKAPFIMAEGQDMGYKQFWDNANTRNFSRLIYKPVTIGGQLAPPPQRNNAEPPVQALAIAIRQAGEDMKATTGIYDASLGARSNEQSGRAIMARQKEGDVANFHYIDNLSRAVRFLGIVLLDLIPVVYDAERMVRISHEDDETELVQINKEFQNDKGEAEIYDLTKGKYDLTVTTGPTFSTRRQEASQSMIEMTQAYPKLAEVGGDIMVRNQDWPGAQELAERLKKMLPPQLQETDENAIPPQVQGQLEQMGQMIQMLTESLNKTQDTIDNKKAELESKERIENLKAENALVLKQVEMGGAANMAVLAKQLEDISQRLAMIGNNQPVEVETSPETQDAEALNAQMPSANPTGQPPV